MTSRYGARIGADDVVARLAGRQHGIVTRRQLLEAGLGGAAIEGRLKRGRLRALYRGVYQAGPVGGPWAREMAAVLAGGPGSLAGGRTAGRLWRFVRSVEPDGSVEILVPRGRRVRLPGIRARECGSLSPDEVGRCEGVPVTSPARTLVDLAAVAGARELERWFARAERMELVNGAGVLSLLQRYPRRPGSPLLRTLLRAGASPKLTRSKAERALLELVRGTELPEPQANARVKGLEVDLLWRRERLVVEVDGFEFHKSRRAFERDRRRDALLVAAGFRVLRVTWRQLTHERDQVLARIAQALVRRV